MISSGESQRRAILEIFLRKELAEEPITDLAAYLATLTEDFSGSDLKELCRAAVMLPIREYAAASAFTSSSASASTSGSGSANGNRIRTGQETASEEEGSLGLSDGPRPLRRGDFQEALKRVRPTGHSADDYFFKEQNARRTSIHLARQRSQASEAPDTGIRQSAHGRRGWQGGHGRSVSDDEHGFHDAQGPEDGEVQEFSGALGAGRGGGAGQVNPNVALALAQSMAVAQTLMQSAAMQQGQAPQNQGSFTRRSQRNGNLGHLTEPVDQAPDEQPSDQAPGDDVD